MNKLLDYLERYALLSQEKQDNLAHSIGEHFFDLDLEAGKARFGGGSEFSVQVLGTQSDNTLTWLWAWAEEQTEIPENLIRSALDLRAWGTKAGIAEFVEPEIDIDRADGRMISLIASEVCAASCYYRDAYEGGALFLLLFGESLTLPRRFDLSSLKQGLSELSADYDINARKTLLAYLAAKNLSPSETGAIVTCGLESGETLSIEFDAHGGLLADFD